MLRAECFCFVTSDLSRKSYLSIGSGECAVLLACLSLEIEFYPSVYYALPGDFFLACVHKYDKF